MSIRTGQLQFCFEVCEAHAPSLSNTSSIVEAQVLGEASDQEEMMRGTAAVLLFACLLVAGCSDGAGTTQGFTDEQFADLLDRCAGFNERLIEMFPPEIPAPTARCLDTVRALEGQCTYREALERLADTTFDGCYAEPLPGQREGYDRLRELSEQVEQAPRPGRG